MRLDEMASDGPRPVRFCLVRIDDRLLHGQVVVNWVRTLRPRRIAIVDDEIATDGTTVSVLEATCPADLALWVGTIAEAATALVEQSPVPPADTMILLRSPAQARALYDAGVCYEALNLGCLGAGAGRRRVHRQVSLSPDEMEALQYLASVGVVVSIQALPSHRAISLATVLSRRRRPSA